MESMLKQEQVTIGVLDQKARRLLQDTGETHVEADAHVEAYTKL
jgi:hypothetical protein